MTSPTTHIQRARSIFGILISRYMNCAVVLESECFIGDGGGEGGGGGGGGGYLQRMQRP